MQAVTSMQLICDEARDRLRCVDDSLGMLDRKSFFLATAYLTVITGVTLTISQQGTTPAYVVLFAGCCAAILWLLPAVCAQKYASLGNEAKKMLDMGLNREECEKVLWSIALTYDEKAAHNEVIAAERGRAINISLRIFGAAAFVAGILAIASHTLG